MPKKRILSSSSLSDFINRSQQNVVETKSKIRNSSISSFNQRVINEGLSLDVQKAFWNNLLASETDSEFPTPDFVIEAKDTLSNLGKQIRAKTFRDTYNTKLTDIAAAKDSYESLRNWLSGQLSSVSDLDLKSEIQNDLQSAEREYTSSTKNAVESLITTGQRDRSLSILKDAEDSSNIRLAEAIGGGNKEMETYWKDRISVIKQSKNQLKAEDSVNAYKVIGLQGGNVIAQLDSLNTAVVNNGADGVPIFISGTRYDNVNAYLQAVRGSFLSDTGPDGFFTKIQKQNSDFLTRVANTSGEIPASTIDSTMRAIDGLLSRAELAGYANQIQDLKFGDKGLIKQAVDSNIRHIVSKFTTSFDFASSAQKISSLSTKYGLNQDETMNALVVEMGKKKEEIAQSIIGAAASIQANEDIPWADAVAKAQQSFRGGMISYGELVEKSISNIVGRAEKLGQTQIKAPGTTTKTAITSTSPIKNANIAKTNPDVVANRNFVNAVFVEAKGRNATKAELDQYAGKKVKDVANLVLRERSPFLKPVTPAAPVVPPTPEVAPLVTQTQNPPTPTVTPPTSTPPTTAPAAPATTTPPVVPSTTPPVVPTSTPTVAPVSSAPKNTRKYWEDQKYTYVGTNQEKDRLIREGKKVVQLQTGNIKSYFWK